jgi:hypothetical protein
MSTSSYLIPLVLFMIFASPATFKAVRGVAGSWVASAEGEAKFAGLLLHAVLFVWVVGFLMRRVSRYGDLHTFSTKTEVHRGPRLGGEWDEQVSGLTDGVESGPMKQARYNLSAASY